MPSPSDYYADVQLLRGRRSWVKLAILLVAHLRRAGRTGWIASTSTGQLATHALHNMH